MGTKVSTLAKKKKKSIASSYRSHTKGREHTFTSDFDEKQKDKRKESDISLTQQCASEITSISNRRFHHVSNSAYWFPNDDEEMDRLIGVKIFFFLRKKHKRKKKDHWFSFLIS
jgi:hypothetical protein